MTLPLRCDGLLLRRVTERDFPDLFECYANEEVARYQFWEPFTEEQVFAMIHSQATVRPGDPGVPLELVVELEPQGPAIGVCSLTITSIDDRQADMGFLFNPKHHGHGYATRAVDAALGYGFKQLGMHRISAATDVRNERSWKLMERVGMRREAHYLHDCQVNGEWIDDYLYAMLDDEWRAM